MEINYLFAVGLGLFFLGAVFGIGVGLNYSNFLARLVYERIQAPDDLTLEYVDGWSSKNFEAMLFFWNGKYQTLESAELKRIGNMTRMLMHLSTLLCALGLVVLLIYDIGRRIW